MDWVCMVLAGWLSLALAAALAFVALIRFAERPSTEVDPESSPPPATATASVRLPRSGTSVPSRHRPRPARARRPVPVLARLGPRPPHRHRFLSLDDDPAGGARVRTCRCGAVRHAP
ncbi:hypothetical protein FHR93_005163 [Geodermatophilus sabuli]|uniref:Uncharacterized protein n=1 Tax=Geodermatophilus sabuli TaxID=1564158 RepID=A0A285EJX3_9ACTN|nr:hypothetical protein [Geodermatophilus sabuli]SNX99418.1 hypothetical protein SAMN06893097_1225 [Geodermatophilus sabuli]